jgi:protein O-GlcNAc transferase
MNTFEMAKNLFLDGLQYFKNQEFQNAEHSFLKSLTLAPNRASTLNNLAATQIKLKKFDEAEQNLRQVIGIDENSIDLWLNLGILHFERKELTQAISYLERCVELDLNHTLAWKLMARAYDQNKEFNRAIICFKKILVLNPNDMDALIGVGAILNDLKQFDASIQYHQLAIKIDPNLTSGYVNMGVALSGLAKYELGIHNYSVALELDPNDSETWSNKGNALHELKRFDEALSHFDKALSLKPDYAEGWSNKGNALYELKRFDEALSHFDKALSLKPDYAEGWSNKGNALHELKRFDEALAHHDKALSIKPDYAEGWSNKGNTLHKLKRFDEALSHHDKALSLKPDYAEGWSNKGKTLHKFKRFDEALFHYDKALSLKPDYAGAWFDKGVTLNELKRYDEAITYFDKTLSLKPVYAEAWFNKGVTLNELKRYDEAITYYDKALSIKPDIDWGNGVFLHAKMKVCNWINFLDSLEIISKKVMANQKVAPPFALLSLNDDAALHKKSAEIYTQDKYPTPSSLDVIPKVANKDKIRIAYFSPDFRNHPVSFITSELFEIHNRDRFEVFAFSLEQAPVGDETNLRLRNGFDKFFDVGNMTDIEIAQFARQNEVDIAIDLAGHTQNCRTGIFSYRAAPIQVNWLGYPGTIGADFIDYIVADRTIIPETHHEFYVEKVVCLPDTYMVDDSKRVSSSRMFTREECGLPKNTFIFCCFNNDYKFNSQVIDGWTRILLRVENSVLWISENNQSFKTNIAAEFEKRGLDRSRLIFAKRLELMADYLARYKVADLFLDTYPYNAHTTTVDSLKAGVPVVTLIGQSFASRVAASLLSATDLPELITSTQEEYEALAVELALNPKKLADIKLRLVNNRLTTPLFDTPLFTKNIEAAYIKMMERYHAGLEPDHIAII